MGVCVGPSIRQGDWKVKAWKGTHPGDAEGTERDESLRGLNEAGGYHPGDTVDTEMLH